MRRPRLQIIRGLPGSGKTTIALKRFPSLLRIETDMYFTRKGKYTFTRDLNTKAVQWFKFMVSQCCGQGMDFVVTGVFAAHTERLLNTLDTALNAGYEVYIKTTTANYGNIHNVPKSHYEAMKKDFLSERDLREVLRNVRHLHFGLMDEKIKIGGKPCKK